MMPRVAVSKDRAGDQELQSRRPRPGRKSHRVSFQTFVQESESDPLCSDGNSYIGMAFKDSWQLLAYGFEHARLVECGGRACWQ
jgi:hypothetical protein